MQTCSHVSDSAHVAPCAVLKRSQNLETYASLSHIGLSHVLHLTCVLQEAAAIQTKCEAAQRELRKTQQMLRQLERQLAKAYMSRKESDSTSQHLQVTFQITVAPVVSQCLLQISSHAMMVFRYFAGLQQVVVQSCPVKSAVKACART